MWMKSCKGTLTLISKQATQFILTVFCFHLDYRHRNRSIERLTFLISIVISLEYGASPYKKP